MKLPSKKRSPRARSAAGTAVWWIALLALFRCPIVTVVRDDEYWTLKGIEVLPWTLQAARQQWEQRCKEPQMNIGGWREVVFLYATWLLRLLGYNCLYVCEEATATTPHGSGEPPSPRIVLRPQEQQKPPEEQENIVVVVREKHLHQSRYFLAEPIIPTSQHTEQLETEQICSVALLMPKDALRQTHHTGIFQS